MEIENILFLILFSGVAFAAAIIAFVVIRDRKTEKVYEEVRAKRMREYGLRSLQSSSPNQHNSVTTSAPSWVGSSDSSYTSDYSSCDSSSSSSSCDSSPSCSCD